VWQCALFNACIENQVFIPTFPIEKMTMEGLKEACALPFRFRSRIWGLDKHRDEKASVPESIAWWPDAECPLMTPMREDKLSTGTNHFYPSYFSNNKSEEDTSNEGGVALRVRFKSTYLVPGGRFLFTSDYYNRVCLWDLGYKSQSNKTFPSTPLAVKSFHAQSELLFKPIRSVQPTADGQGLVLMVYGTPPTLMLPLLLLFSSIC
jgi:hypothetical protein